MLCKPHEHDDVSLVLGGEFLRDVIKPIRNGEAYKVDNRVVLSIIEEINKGLGISTKEPNYFLDCCHEIGMMTAVLEWERGHNGDGSIIVKKRPKGGVDEGEEVLFTSIEKDEDLLSLWLINRFNKASYNETSDDEFIFYPALEGDIPEVANAFSISNEEVLSRFLGCGLLLWQLSLTTRADFKQLFMREDERDIPLIFTRP